MRFDGSQRDKAQSSRHPTAVIRTLETQNQVFPKDKLHTYAHYAIHADIAQS